MANNKMLIDASHPEETRVVVVRGNRIEEFDFEAQDRRQLRGNIYLAKVTRVEPSLQAAFIDYGGNRHGFLAFSEIHPDYYQIPAADRQALLAAEAEAAAVADEENEVSMEEAALLENEEGDDDDAPRKRRRKPRRGGRGRKSREDRADGDDPDDDPDDDDDDNGDDNGDTNAEDGVTADHDGDDDTIQDDDQDNNQESGETPKPKKKRARRPRKKKTSGEVTASSDESDSDDVLTTGPRTIAAMMDMDVISEDAPEDDSGEDASEPETVEKPKRKPRARKSTKKAESEAAAVEEEAETDSADATASEDAEEAEKPKKRARRKAPAKKKAKAEALSESGDDLPAVEASSDEDAGDTDTGKSEADTDGDADDAPARSKKRRNRRKSRADKSSDNDDDDDSRDEEADENGKNVESVGQEDALEEVPVRRPRRQYKIQEVIRRRQVMLVQVVKEERGNKGAALTTYLSLAGRYSVLMPNTARGGGISRKITNPADRKRLKEIAGSLEVPAGMGVILRTAGASLEKEDIQRDFDYLMRLWENVRDLTLESSAPFLVYEEGSLIKRSIRDLYNKEIGEIIVAGEEGYREAREFMQMLMPGHGRNVKLYNGEQSLLSKYNVESQLDKMVTPQVTLKSGGYLIINQTEALVAIDVNSGKSTREHSIEATALQTNLEAAEEVARQLRLRDLAGLVVIDFIDMEEKRNNRAVERKLKECLKNDRARIQVGHISHFGLLEMSRQRIRASVLESTMAVCPTCHGVGHIRSEPSFALQIVRAIDDHLNRHSRNDVIVKIPPSTAIYILNHKRSAVSELEDRYGVAIAFESDPTIEGQDFNIERGEAATRSPRRREAINPMDTPMNDPVEDDEDEAYEEISVVEDSDDRDGPVSRDRNPDSGERDRGERDRGGKRQRGRGRGRGRNRDESYREDGNREQRNAGRDLSGDDEAPREKRVEGPGRGEKLETRPALSERPERPERPARPEKPAPAADTEMDSEPAEPRRRTGRPGKKVRAGENAVSKSENKTDTGSETVSAGKSNGAPPRKVERRNTRRVTTGKGDAAASATDNDGGSGAPDQPKSWGSGFLG